MEAVLLSARSPSLARRTGVPYNIVNLRTGHAKNPSWTAQASTLAEFGTQQLEFVALSHATGDPKYAEMSEHIIKVGKRLTVGNSG